MGQQVRQLKSGYVIALLADLEFAARESLLEKVPLPLPTSPLIDTLKRVGKQAVFRPATAFGHHVAHSVYVVQVAAVPLQQKPHRQMIRVCRRRVVELQGQFVNHDGDNLILSGRKQVKKVLVEGSGGGHVTQSPELFSPVENILTVEDNGFIRVMRNVPLFQRLHLAVDLPIVTTFCPAAKQAQKTVSGIVQMFEDMISRLINVETESLV
jgi:hypothetical protein